ncbi:ABC transporter [Flammeovirgaceae bacterium 311]|nr:ABC transporter [Flammeovirgaceae bacterium 311]
MQYPAVLKKRCTGMKRAPSDDMDFLKVAAIGKKEERGFELKELSFSQQRFSNIAIAGETGSGKSTIMKIIAGLVQPDTGEVYFEGQRVKGPDEKLVPGHPGIAYLSQQFELAGFLRVEQVLKYANTLSPQEAESIIGICRIEHLLKRKTDQLSGGERQRIAIARLLISAPRLLLLDEPFSNLDIVHKNVLRAVIHDIGESLKITCMMISHDPQDTLSWADDILVIKGGELLQQGSPEQIYRQPKSAYIAGLFGKFNLLPPTKAKALAALSSISTNGKNLLIRPEAFRIVTAADGGLEGIVKRSTFFGSYYEVEVSVQNKIMITVRTDTERPARGETVYLQLPQEAVWFI